MPLLLKSRAVLIVLCFAFNGSFSQSFVEVSENVGIECSYVASNLMGGGLAWFDYNNDSLIDLYITCGPDMDRLYRNNGDGTFTDKSFSANIAETDNRNTTGVVTGDIDNDGHREIFVTTWNSGLSAALQKNFLFYNNGDGSFTEIGVSAGLTEEKLTMAATFIDVNLDGFLDLVTGNYIDEPAVIYDDQNNPIGFAHDCYTDDLYLNNGDLTFTLANDLYGAENVGCTLAILGSDYDRDGDQDLMCANDFGDWVMPNTLLQNNYPDSSWTDVSGITGAGIQVYGMGLAHGDYDEDGDMDYYCTNLGRNVLLNNVEKSSFADSTEYCQVESENFLGGLAVGWGTFFFDYDNDSYLDLFVSNGKIESVSWLPNSSFQLNQLFHGSATGVFEDVTDNELEENDMKSRGCAYADFNQDGALDFGVVNSHNLFNASNDAFTLYENQLDAGNYIAFQLQGVSCNADAFGALIELHAGNRVFIKEVVCGSSYASQNSSVAHFGLGAIEQVDSAIVYWPKKSAETFNNLQHNQLNYLVQDTVQFIVLPKDTLIVDTLIVDTLIVDTLVIDTTFTDTLITWIEAQRILPLHAIIRPNPVRSEFQISCTIPSSGLLNIVWKDQLGQSIWLVYEEFRNEGMHEIKVKVPPNLAQGVYICEVHACGQSLVKRIVFSGD
jgi:hypothetical protein